ncbi:MAG: metal-dependent transcriptional regulator [Demequina sp.]|uniref:metal-dependent transcriptional regulator n=1 Tax=Demequina sp. TaxID=2050685 RepID=UPI0019C2FCAB|nr:metal-dependent transcriptional regulator [Demequina sp.]MBC7299044.1 metal-dependent transcriptional regulator [Demequina sp.]
MAVSELSTSTQDYVKCVWTLQEWSGGAVSVTALAERLGVRTSTASDGVKKLAEQGLVAHETYGGITLTDEGTAHALAMVRRHRLLESYLVQELGYSWDEVHDEAEILEHAVSDRLMAAIDARLGHPTRDPHGDPIPSSDGSAHLPHAVPLSHAEPGPAVIVRLSDSDPERLRRFAGAGLKPETKVHVGDDGTVEVADSVVALDPDDSASIWVTGSRD